MTVTAPPRPPEPPARDDLEALIEEARGRARRRRLWYGACAALALLSGGLAWFLGHNGGGGPTGRAGSGLEPSSARPSAQPKPPPQFVRVARGYTAAEAGLVAPGAGWAMNGLGLYWTHDNGDHWRRITPPDVA